MRRFWIPLFVAVILALSAAPACKKNPSGPVRLYLPTHTPTPSITGTQFQTDTPTNTGTVTPTLTVTKTGTPTVTGTLPVIAPLTGEILFHELNSLGCAIYKMNPDGTGVTALTTGEFEDRNAKWNSNKSKILFERGPCLGGCFTSNIWIMDADGSNPVQLTFNNTELSGSDWSPDDSQIVFNADGTYIVVVNADGTGAVTVAPDGRFPNWGSNNRIVFSGSPKPWPNPSDICVMDSDGSNKTTVLELPYQDLHPSWNSTCSEIAFDHMNGESEEICIVRADGTGLRQYARWYDEIDIWQPIWSPDDQYIVYFAEGRCCPYPWQNFGIYRMYFNGLYNVKIRQTIEYGLYVYSYPTATDWR